MEHRIRCLEHNIRRIMDHLHLDYEEPCTTQDCVAGRLVNGDKSRHLQSLVPQPDLKYDTFDGSPTALAVGDSHNLSSLSSLVARMPEQTDGQSVQPTTSAGPVQFFSPNAAAALAELARSRVSSTDKKKFVPVEDGFITTAGNKDLGAKYGNTTGSNRIGYIDYSYLRPTYSLKLS